MKDMDQLTPQESLKLITQVITQARNKFEENGRIYVFWGALVSIVSIGQFILLNKEYYNISWYPYLLIPIGAIISSIYFRNKNAKRAQTMIGKIISALWIVLSINMLILGFLFWPNLRENLIPIILILLSIGTIVSGASIRSKLIIISGIIIGISGYVSFYVDWIYQPLILGIVSVIAVLIPGIILMIQSES